MATFTGKTAKLVDLPLFPCLMDAREGPRGIVGLFHFSFVCTVGYII